MSPKMFIAAIGAVALIISITVVATVVIIRSDNCPEPTPTKIIDDIPRGQIKNSGGKEF